VLNRGAQADSCGATQVLDRDGKVVARGSCLSYVLDRVAQVAARGAFPCVQILNRGPEAAARDAARCASHLHDRDAQTGA